MMRAVVFLMLLSASTSVLAHAYLVKSAPVKRAVLHNPPAKIQLWFNERLEQRFSTVALYDSAGKAVAIGPAALDASDPKQLTATVGPLVPGRYLIKYRVLSTDGHIVQDQIPFTVGQ